jgi:nitroreductase
MDLDLSPRELLTTTRTVRKRLDLTKAVARDDVEECVRIGWQAPNGSNQQMYNWVLVDDPATRVEMARIYREGMDFHIAMSAQAREEGTAQPYAVDDRQGLIGASVFYLREHLHEVPVLLVPTIDGRMESQSIFDQAGRWGSVLPAVWNFMLALRSKGMGSAWTTIHLHKEQEMAQLLGIPYDDVTQAGLFPVAYTIGTDFRAASRAHSEKTIHWNSW